MSNIQTSSIKNGAINHHTPEDSVYLKSIRVSCHLCNLTGPTKIRTNAWKLHCHFLHEHGHEEKLWREIEDSLCKLIRLGVLR